MNPYETQLEERMRLDNETLNRSYSKLATSVGGDQTIAEMTSDELERQDAALAICLRYYGKKAPSLPVTEGSLTERLDRTCAQAGLLWREVNLTSGWHKKASGALLGTLETGEAVALLPSGARHYRMVKPLTGERIRVNDAVSQAVSSRAICFYRMLPPKELGARDLIRFMMGVFDRNDFFLVAVAALAITLVGLLPAAANKLLFGTVIPSSDDSLILPIAALLVGVATSSTVVKMCHSLVMSRISTKIQTSVEAAVFARVLMLPASFFKEYSGGNLANRVSTTTSLCQQLMSILLGAGLSSLMSLIYVGQIGAYAPSLVIPALIVIVVSTGSMVASTLINSRYDRRMMEENSKLSGTVTALLNATNKIKLAGAENRAFSKWADDYATYAHDAYERPKLLRALPGLSTAIQLIGTAVIYYFAVTGNVSVANFMAFNAAYGSVMGAINTLASMAVQAAQIRPALDLLSPILKSIPEVEEERESARVRAGGIEVSGISFKYNETSPYVLKDLSFKVRPGEYVGLVGRSGCGKSTILRLLLGFEKPERGAVYYDGQDISKVAIRSLRRSIGTVTQDGRLFLGTIQSNITLSNPSATLNEAWEAAEMAGIADDIREMPMGMQTLVTEGSGGLSGGQRQRILIARAVCGKRKVLIFDEATSALDNVTQKHVSDSLEKLNCTRLAIAHRLSTVRHCDRILVVDGGRIAEEGTYEELIEKRGLFYELVSRQRIEGED